MEEEKKIEAAEPEKETLEGEVVEENEKIEEPSKPTEEVKKGDIINISINDGDIDAKVI